MRKKAEETKEVIPMTAMEIASDIKEIVDRVIEADGEISETDYEALKNLKMDLTQKAQNIAFVKLRLESQIDYFKQIKAAADQRVKALDKSLSNMKKYLAACMKEADVKSLKDNQSLFSVSLTAGKPSVVVDDLNLLDFEYCEFIEVQKPKLKEIKEALDAGKTVKGAHIEFGEDYVTFRGGKAE